MVRLPLPGVYTGGRVLPSSVGWSGRASENRRVGQQQPMQGYVCACGVEGIRGTIGGVVRPYGASVSTARSRFQAELSPTTTPPRNPVPAAIWRKRMGAPVNNELLEYVSQPIWP